MRQLIETELLSERKTIAIKGYDGLWGRATLVLKALQQCVDLLENYTIEIYSADELLKNLAREFSLTTGVPVKILEQAKNTEILKLFGRSRIGIGMSISDGTPNSMLEEMIMGTFPIQSDTISTAEWIINGENGLLVPPENVSSLTKAIRLALTDDKLVNEASNINKNIMLQRVDYSVLQSQIISLYEKVFRQSIRI